jgi:ATP-dependent Lon protease
MRAQLPVVPVKDFIVLPGTIARQLLIRPDAVTAVERALEANLPVLVVPQVDPLVDEVLPEDLGKIGCTATVVRCVRLGDGTARVLLEGLARAQVHGARQETDGSFTAQARPLAETVRDPKLVAVLATRLQQALQAFIELPAPSHPALARLADISLTPSALADHIAGSLTLQHAERVAWLEDAVVDTRLLRALEGLERERVLRDLKISVEKGVQGTLDKQQKEFYLKEQIRSLRKELGETPDQREDDVILEEKLRAAGLPEEGLQEALRELDRLRRMHSDAGEYTVTRTWLDWLISIPWSKLSEDKHDLIEAKAVLDADHYGLTKVKDRILEYLAVRMLKPDSQGPVLCFVGPPGVGKTSLGRSVAKALGRQFQRISLGGVHDEAEIRGHRRTYVGALPGRIAHALKRAGTRNPVIVLDEIDELGKDFRGDPASALLEVLDPEQNTAFMDHYLDVPLDLSQVLFICTANSSDPIPEALIDRLELTELPGYTLEEKLHIANQHLLERLRLSHGFEPGWFTVLQPAVQHVIEAFTRESGVRRLDQHLSALHRKAARRIVEGGPKDLVISDADGVRDMLGPPRHFIELAERADQPGIVIGLAWTPSGGDILFIEATSWADEKSSLRVTGLIGDSMKESAEAAMSIIKTRAPALGITPAAWKERGVHVHIPAGGIRKDGPSAGVGLVTALCSLMTGRLVRPGLAMTGEITLRGKVLPVGGIKEKVLAARRAGVREVILPRLNENDLVDIAPEIRDELQFLFVDHVDQVLALSLLPAPEPTGAEA